jgi:putative PEP-CTERM system TPR-repeat lipoprotein
MVAPGMMLALIMLRNGKYDEALGALQKVMARDPKNPLVYNLIASAQWGKGDRETARRNLERAIQLEPNLYSAQRNLARLDLQEGKTAAAKERFRSLVGRPGIGVGPLVDLAEIEEKEGNLREAVSLLTKAQNEAPDNVSAQLRLISLLGRMGDGDAAIRAARKLDNKVADNPRVLEALGRTELAFGKVDDAANAFRRLAKAAPDNPDSYLNVARLQTSAKDLSGAHATLKRAMVSHENHFGLLEALIDLEAALELYDDALLRTDQLIKRYPKRAIGYRLRGDVLIKMRKFDDAALLFAEAIEREPSGPLLVRQYMARRAAGIARPSLQALEDWTAAHPKDYVTRRMLATGYMDAGQREKALALNEKLVSEQPRDPVVLNNLAWLYFEDGDPRALETAEKAYSLAPKAAQTLDTLGWILVNSGDSGRGLQLLRDAFVRDSRDPTLRYHLAVALSRQGQDKEAKKHLEALLAAGNADAEITTKSRALLASLQGG